MVLNGPYIFILKMANLIGARQSQNLNLLVILNTT